MKKIDLCLVAGISHASDIVEIIEIEEKKRD